MVVKHQDQIVTLLYHWNHQILLMTLFVLCFLAAIAIAAPEGTVYEQGKHDEITCATKVCIEEATIVKGCLNESADPCENFYEFACGNFRKITKKSEYTKFSAYSIIENLVQKQLRPVFNEQSPLFDSKPFQLVKNFNLACMNGEMIESRGIQPLLHIFHEFSSWPIVIGNRWSDDEIKSVTSFAHYERKNVTLSNSNGCKRSSRSLWSEHIWNWPEMLKKFRRVGFDTNFIFKLDVVPNSENSNYILGLTQPVHKYEREYLIKGSNNAHVETYYKAMTGFASIFGGVGELLGKELGDALQFEIKLAKISVPQQELRNLSATYNEYTIKQFQESYPYLDWLDYINAMLPIGMEVTEDEIVINGTPTFFEQLGEVLNSTANHTITNYLMWRALFDISHTLTESLRKFGIYSRDEPRWRECVEETSEKLSILVDALYVRKYLNEETRQAVTRLTEDIRNAFISNLDNVTWMDDKTRREATKKAKSMAAHIGYSNDLSDNNRNEIEAFYKDLELEPDSWFFNTLRVSIFDTNRLFSMLHKPVNMTNLWGSEARSTTANAFYFPEKNCFYIPAAMLQRPFFSLSFPQYINYASIGFIIGHEFSHGFDDTGRQLDYRGSLLDWWKPETKEKFSEKEQCFIEQYSNFMDIESNLSLNGLITLDEDIADNGGVQMAYYAYRNWVERNGAEGILPGMNYNQQQLFWIATAQKMCITSNHNEEEIQTDVHSPNEFRVEGAFSNMPEFAIDFNCPVGSHMNPVKKCSVW